MDGAIFAQPLYIQSLAVPGAGTRNVLFVATMNDVVYAFDADQSAPPIWTRDFRNPAESVTTASNYPWIKEYGPNLGVLSTPVIDLPSNSMYLVAQTIESGNYVWRVHSIDIRTGLDKVDSAVVEVPDGAAVFDAFHENQRPGLVLVNGQVVIAFGGRPHDDQPYHGFVMTFDMGSLVQTGVFGASTTENGAAIWQSGGAPPIDAAGRFYFLTGNGFRNGYDGTANFGETLLQMSTANGVLSLQNWFTPSNWSSLDTRDLDLSVNAPMLIPGTDLVAFGSKTADVYVAHTGSLGELTMNDTQLAAFFHVGTGTVTQFNDGNRIIGLVYWARPQNSLLYAWPGNDSLHSFTFDGTTNFTPAGNNMITGFGEPGIAMSLSANGSQTGTGIIWATVRTGAGRTVGQAGVLYAIDAENPSHELWDSRMNPTRDDMGALAKFVIPVVANGRVYMATSGGTVNVYGLNSNFSVGVPATLSIVQAANATANIAVTPSNGFSGLVNFSATALPAGVTASFAPTSTAGGASVLTLSASPAAVPGSYTINVTGTSGSLVNFTPMQLTVAGSSDFALSGSTATLSIGSGSSASMNVTAAAVNGFNGAVGLTAAGLPTGVTASFSPLTITAGAFSALTLNVSLNTAPGTYNVTIVGVSGALNHKVPLALTVAPVSAGAIALGNGFAPGSMQLNGSAAISGSRLRLTSGLSNQAASAFYPTAMNVQSFTTDFTFQLTHATADGFAFVIQGTGPTALGFSGGGLGFRGVPKSIGVKFDFFSNRGEGKNSTGLYTNGADPVLPSVDMTASGINLHTSNVFSVHISYDGATLAAALTDTVTGKLFTQSYPVNIPSLVGASTAYAGFTAGTGGLTATQEIVGWTYIPSSAPAPAPTPTAVRINACGSTAGSFGSDLGISNGGCSTIASPVDLSGVASAAPQTVYQTKRTPSAGSTAVTYTIPGLLAGYQYHVRLHFADDLAWRSGFREFNVLINGNVVLSNFDIFKVAGAKLRAVTQDIIGIAPNAQGQIVIQCQNVTRNALVSGIEILP